MFGRLFGKSNQIYVNRRPQNRGPEKLVTNTNKARTDEDYRLLSLNEDIKEIGTVIFTDPNIPGIMKDVTGGDIDDLFMILDVVVNTPKSVIVIGGEHGTSANRYTSFINAIETDIYMKQLDSIATKNHCHFISQDRFISEYIDKLPNKDCYIFCPINRKIFDYTQTCTNVFMQGKGKMDFNVKMAYDENGINEQLITDIIAANSKITPIDSLISGTPIPISDIKHPFIDIAKKTALAKTLGLGGIKTFLYGFFICSGEQPIVTHKGNNYDAGVDFQDDLLKKLDIFPQSINKGNTSIPILNYIASKDENYKNMVIDLIIKYKNSDNIVDELLNGLIDNSGIKSKIKQLLDTPQGKDGMKPELKVMILVIFGFCYKICGQNLETIFYTQKEASEFGKNVDDIKEFNHIDVNQLIKSAKSSIMNSLFSNLQLWDLVGYHAFKKGSKFKETFVSKDVDVIKIKEQVKEHLAELLKNVRIGTSMGGSRRKKRTRDIRRTKRLRRNKRKSRRF